MFLGHLHFILRNVSVTDSRTVAQFQVFFSVSRSALTSNVALVGGLEHFSFVHILGVNIPIDFHIFQKGLVNHQPVSHVAARN